MSNEVSDLVRSARQLDAINDAIDRNNRSIGDMKGTLEEVASFLTGNGEPSRGLLYRVEWMERAIITLGVIIGLNAIATFILIVAMIIHLASV